MSQSWRQEKGVLPKASNADYQNELNAYSAEHADNWRANINNFRNYSDALPYAGGRADEGYLQRINEPHEHRRAPRMRDADHVGETLAHGSGDMSSPRMPVTVPFHDIIGARVQHPQQPMAPGSGSPRRTLREQFEDGIHSRVPQIRRRSEAAEQYGGSRAGYDILKPPMDPLARSPPTTRSLHNNSGTKYDILSPPVEQDASPTGTRKRHGQMPGYHNYNILSNQGDGNDGSQKFMTYGGHKPAMRNYNVLNPDNGEDGPSLPATVFDQHGRACVIGRRKVGQGQVSQVFDTSPGKPARAGLRRVEDRTGAQGDSVWSSLNPAISPLPKDAPSPRGRRAHPAAAATHLWGGSVQDGGPSERLHRSGNRPMDSLGSGEGMVLVPTPPPMRQRPQPRDHITTLYNDGGYSPSSRFGQVRAR